VSGLPRGEWVWLVTAIGNVKRFQEGSNLLFGWPERAMDEGRCQRFEKVILRGV